jgi:hypothetical protein
MFTQKRVSPLYDEFQSKVQLDSFPGIMLLPALQGNGETQKSFVCLLLILYETVIEPSVYIPFMLIEEWGSISSNVLV